MRTPTTIADGTQIDYGLGTRLGLLMDIASSVTPEAAVDLQPHSNRFPTIISPSLC
jgi:hypothetical protein